MTHPLLVWLNGVLKAEETVALAAIDPWRRTVRRRGAKWPERPATDEDGTLLAFHNAYHSPPSVLAVVEAHRVLLELHAPAVHQAERYGRPHGEPHEYCVTCIGGTPCECCPVDHPDNQWPCATVRALASAYRYSDGWDESWGPT